MVFPHSTGKRLAARRLCRTNTQLRSPRFTHQSERGKLCSAWRPVFPVSLWAMSVAKCCADEAMRTHTAVRHDVACRAVAWCLLCGHVPWCRGRHAQSCRVISCWISCLPSTSVLDTHNSTLPCSLPVPRKQFPPTVLPAARRNTNHTSTDCDVHDYVDPGTELECGSCSTRRKFCFCASVQV